MRYTIEYKSAEGIRIIAEGTKVIKADFASGQKLICEIHPSTGNNNSGGLFILKVPPVQDQMYMKEGEFSMWGDIEREEFKALLKIILEHL
jgi:hypothetical protein